MTCFTVRIVMRSRSNAGLLDKLIYPVSLMVRETARRATWGFVLALICAGLFVSPWRLHTNHELFVFAFLECRLIPINDDERARRILTLGGRYTAASSSLLSFARFAGAWWRLIWTRTGSSDRRRKSKAPSRRGVGKAVGDAKLEAEGKADEVEGKVQNAIGGLKDTLRDTLKGK